MRTGTVFSKTVYMLGLLAAPVILPVMLPTPAQAAIGISVNIALPPPELPVYEQPPVPAPDYVWVPGYWAYGPYGYYWVPGTWVLPPEPGLLWTPGYWAWDNGLYRFHTGYWGPYVGFYGGVNYGFGYFGHGYEGGYWEGGHFHYNAAVTRFDDRGRFMIYDHPVAHFGDNRVSFNGGNGLHDHPSPQELSYAHMRVSGPTPQQREHRQDAIANPELRQSVNQGRPPIAATPRASQFEAPNTVRAQGAQPHVYMPPEAQHQQPVTHAPPQFQPRPEPEQHMQMEQPQMRQPEPQIQPHVEAAPAIHQEQHQIQPHFQPRPQPAPQLPHEEPHAAPPQGGGEHRDEGPH